jgi:PAS domain S-box-containing protein
MTPTNKLCQEVFRLAPGLSVSVTLFDSLPDVLFCLKDRQRRYISVNDAFIRSVGLRSRADLMGRTARSLFPAALAAGYEQQDDFLLGGGPEVRDRLEMITRSDGSIGWFVSQKVPVHGPTGQVVAIAGISRDLDTRTAADTALGPLAQVMDRLHLHYAEPLRIRDLAQEAKMSLSQFQRRVTSLTGLTPRQLLTKIRVEAAATALRVSNVPLSKIATECGFYDQAVLTKQFREYTGVPPGEYRRAFRVETVS